MRGVVDKQDARSEIGVNLENVFNFPFLGNLIISNRLLRLICRERSSTP